MKTKFKYIHFEEVYKNWLCIANNRLAANLGLVEYYKPWKEWVFNAEHERIIFSAGCLRDIAEFLEELNGN